MAPSSASSPWTPLRDRLNASGVPFQLAVEKFMRDRGPQYGSSFVGHEVTWEKGFLDVLFRKGFIYLAMECKKVADDTWVFVLTDESRESRCRLEWHDPRLPDPELPVVGETKVFCSEFAVAESSPESGFALLPKGGPNKILEPLARELIDACRDILDDSDRAHDEDHWEVLVTWVSDRERTVFVVGARHLAHFMHGFRSFYCVDEGGNPKEWNNPPDV